jgi:hypothetical protein
MAFWLTHRDVIPPFAGGGAHERCKEEHRGFGPAPDMICAYGTRHWSDPGFEAVGTFG